jgi:hypothetical protein
LHKSSLGGHGQKLIGALNSARIGEDAMPKKFQNYILKNWWGLERAQKWWKYEHKSSLGGRGQKLISALNSTRIGEDAKPKQFQLFSSQIEKVWKELKNDENMSISQVWVVVDKNWLVRWTQLELEKMLSQKNFKFFPSKIGEVWKELKNDENMSISWVWVVMDKN